MEITIKEKAKRLAELLCKENKDGVSFDWRTYDYDEDIPRVFLLHINNEVKVSGFTISEDGTELIINYLSNPDSWMYDDIVVKIDEHTEEELEEMCIGLLICDGYYETDYSWSSGDDYQAFLINGIKDECFGSKTYNVTATLIYNGSIQVSANSEEEAMEKADKVLSQINTHFDIPYFDFGECTIDYAEED